MCSHVRNVNAMMLIVVVLSVQLRNTLASHTQRFWTSCVCPKPLVTACFGSLPILHVPVSCKLHPGMRGSFADPSYTPPAFRMISAHTSFEKPAECTRDR